MSAVDLIIEKARAAVREFEAHVKEHEGLIKNSQAVDGPHYSAWLASLTDEDDRALDRHARLEVQARVARRTLEFWGESA